jgi:hypothetical protein
MKQSPLSCQGQLSTEHSILSPTDQNSEKQPLTNERPTTTTTPPQSLSSSHRLPTQYPHHQQFNSNGYNGLPPLPPGQLSLITNDNKSYIQPSPYHPNQQQFFPQNNNTTTTTTTSYYSVDNSNNATTTSTPPPWMSNLIEQQQQQQQQTMERWNTNTSTETKTNNNGKYIFIIIILKSV